MSRRPLSVTLISVLYLAGGALGLGVGLIGANARRPFEGDIGWIVVVNLIAIVCGVFLLYGYNWARWLAAAWMGFHVLLSFFHHSLLEIVLHSALFAIVVLILFFLPAANQYFRGGGKATQSP